MSDCPRDNTFAFTTNNILQGPVMFFMASRLQDFKAWRLCFYIHITQVEMLTIWQSVPSSSRCHLYLCKYSTTILLKTNISYSIFCLIGGVPPGRQGSLRPARNTRLHSCVKNMPVKYLPHTKFTFCLLSSNFNRYQRLLSFWFIDASVQKVCIKRP